MRPTGGFFHSHTLGLTGSETSPKSRQSPSRATPNGDHPNGSPNGSRNGSHNGPTALPTVRQGRAAATAWELPALVRPLPIRRRPKRKKPRLLSHYPAVLEYVHARRFATAAQVQRRFPGELRTRRTAQYQLANLVQGGYLATTPVRSTGPHFPFVYHCTRRGANLIRGHYRQQGRRWGGPATETAKRRGAGLDSILHELLVTEYEDAVWATVQCRADLECPLTERRYFRRDRQLRFTEKGRTRRVVPDAGFLLRVHRPASGPEGKSGTVLLLHLVEFDNGTTPPARIARKYQHYAAWAESAAGQDYLTKLYRRYGGAANAANFRLVVIAHAKYRPGGDTERLADLLATALDLPVPMRDRIWLATAEDLRAHQHDARPLDAAIWLRARGARAWLPEYRRAMRAAEDKGAQRHATARTFVAGRLGQMPRHPLFPRP